MDPRPSSGEVKEQLQLYNRVFPIIPLKSAVSLEAVRGGRDHSFRYFGAQIWGRAKLSQMPVILRKDFPGGATVEAVTFRNPLTEAFDLADL